MSNEADKLMEVLIVALVGAFRDPRRKSLMETGIDERDLAYEADLLEPADVETARYVGHRRRGVVRTYKHMESIGLLKLVDRSGVFSVMPTETSMRYYDYFTKPFWKKWVLRVRNAAPQPLSSLKRKDAG